MAKRIGPGEIFTQLPDHAEAIVAGPRSQVPKALLITIGDRACNPFCGDVIFDQIAVEVAKSWA